MRTLFLSLLCLFGALTVLQAQDQSHGIAYQAVARDADGDPLSVAALDVRITLMGSSGALWQETQSVTTSQFGNLALTIGDGASTPGMTESLDMVDWSVAGLSFSIEVDAGAGYASFGEVDVQAVPIAMYALNGQEEEIAALQSQLDGLDSDVDGFVGDLQDAVAGNTAANGDLEAALAANATADAAESTAGADALAANAAADAAESADGDVADAALQSAIEASEAYLLGLIESNDGEISILQSSTAANTADLGDLLGVIQIDETGITVEDLTITGSLDIEGSFSAGTALFNNLAANNADFEDMQAESAQIEDLVFAEALGLGDVGILGDVDVSGTVTAGGNVLTTEAYADAGDAANAQAIAANAAADAQDELDGAAALAANASADADQASDDALALAANATADADQATLDAGAQSANATAISDETTRAMAAEGVLQTNIDAVQTDVNNNQSSSDGADDQLQLNIDAVQLDVNNNEASSIAADGVLAAGIATNVTNIANEVTDRTDADISLQGQIDNNDSDITTLNSGLAAEQAARQFGDAVNNNSIGALQVNLNAEIEDREDADASLDAYDAVLLGMIEGIAGSEADVAAIVEANDFFDASGNTVSLEAPYTAISADNLITSSVSTNSLAAQNADLDAADIQNLTIESDMTSPSGTITAFDATTVEVFSTLEVDGATTLNSTLNVSGETTLGADVSVTGNVSVSGNVSASDATTAGQLASKGQMDAADAVLQGQITTNDTDIAANLSAIQSNDTEIAANLSAIQSNDTDITNLQTELDATQTGAGLGTDGSYTANATNYAATATSLAGADADLDAALKQEETDRIANDYWNLAAGVLTPDAGITDVDMGGVDVQVEGLSASQAIQAPVGMITQITSSEASIEELQAEDINTDDMTAIHIRAIGTTISTVDFDGTLNVDGTSTLAGLNAQATTTTTLNATGAADLDDGLNVDGATTMDATQMDGDLTLNGSADISTDIDVDGIANLDVTDIDGTLNVAGTSTLAGLDAQATTTTTLNATGAADLDDGLNVDGATTMDATQMDGDLDLNASADISGTLDVTGLITGNLLGDVDGDLTGDVKAENGTIILQNGTDGTDAIFTGDLIGNASTATALENARDFSVSGDATTAAPVSFNGTANVALSISLGTDVVDSDEIKASAVDTDELAADAVTNAELADNAVNTENILDGGVATADLAADAVTNAQLADNAVNTENILNGGVATADLADLSVTTAKIADLNVTTAKLADDAVTNAKLADVAVQTENIKDANVTNVKLANDNLTIGTTNIELGATASELRGLDRVDSDKIMVNPETANEAFAADIVFVVQDVQGGEILTVNEATGQTTVQDLYVNGTTTWQGDMSVTGGVGSTTNMSSANQPTDASHLTRKDYVDGLAAALQTELDDTQTGAGLNGDGDYIVDVTTNYLNAASSLANADFKLDAQAKTNAEGINTLDITTVKLTGVQEISDVKTFTSTIGGDIDGNAATVTNGVYTTSSVTALVDVTSVGSGAIITDTERTKLDGIEAAADVTDATNVAAAGAVMNAGDESIAGVKTFTSTIAGSINGNAATVTDGRYTTDTQVWDYTVTSTQTNADDGNNYAYYLNGANVFYKDVTAGDGGNAASGYDFTLVGSNLPTSITLYLRGQANVITVNAGEFSLTYNQVVLMSGASGQTSGGMVLNLVVDGMHTGVQFHFQLDDTSSAPDSTF